MVARTTWPFATGFMFAGLLVSVSAFRSNLNIIPGEKFGTPCSRSCFESGPDPLDWDVYSSGTQLQLCQQPVLFDFNIHGSLNEDPQHVRACTVWGADFENTSDSPQFGQGAVASGQTTDSLEATLAWWGEPSAPDSDNGIAANAFSSIRNAAQYLRARPGVDQK